MAAGAAALTLETGTAEGGSDLHPDRQEDPSKKEKREGGFKGAS
jgi:hypothetical protein